MQNQTSKNTRRNESQVSVQRREGEQDNEERGLQSRSGNDLGFGFSPWLDDFFRPLRILENMFQMNTGERQQFMPVFETEARENEYLIRAEIPGVPKENVNIEWQDNQLTISGERRQESGRSRYYGSFQRTFTLPSGIDADQIKAECENGLLTIHIPRPQQSRSRRIEIGAGAPTGSRSASEAELAGKTGATSTGPSEKPVH